jgi:hypothetical protein
MPFVRKVNKYEYDSNVDGDEAQDDIPEALGETEQLEQPKETLKETFEPPESVEQRGRSTMVLNIFTFLNNTVHTKALNALIIDHSETLRGWWIPACNRVAWNEPKEGGRTVNALMCQEYLYGWVGLFVMAAYLRRELPIDDIAPGVGTARNLVRFSEGFYTGDIRVINAPTNFLNDVLKNVDIKRFIKVTFNMHGNLNKLAEEYATEDEKKDRKRIEDHIEEEKRKKKEKIEGRKKMRKEKMESLQKKTKEWFNRLSSGVLKGVGANGTNTVYFGGESIKNLMEMIRGAYDGESSPNPVNGLNTFTYELVDTTTQQLIDDDSMELVGEPLTLAEDRPLFIAPQEDNPLCYTLHGPGVALQGQFQIGGVGRIDPACRIYG